METRSRSRQNGDSNISNPASRNTNNVLKIATALICGFVFGFSVEKGRVFEPSIIMNQMLMQKFIMLKMFLSAVITGMFSMSILSMIPASRQQFLNARQSLTERLKGKGYLTVMSGGFMLGSGMTLAGTCPGVVFAQLGSGTTNSGYVLVGTLIGALLYGILEPVLTSLTKPVKPIKQQYLFHVLGSPYFVIALPIAAALGIIVFTLELSFPWSEENTVSDKLNENLWMTSSWQPVLAGGIIGFLQIPLVLVMEGLLGASTSYCTVVSQILVTRSAQNKVPYLMKYKDGLKHWWKVLFVMAAIGGAYISSNLSGTYSTVQGMSVPLSVCGGALMIIGARLADGCTSGHGISGIGLLNMLSIATMISAFAGGMTTATLIQLFT